MRGETQLLIFANDAAKPPDGFFKIPGNGFFAKLEDNEDDFAGATGAASSFLGASFLVPGFPIAGLAVTAGFDGGKLDFEIGLFFNIDDAAFLGSSD